MDHLSLWPFADFGGILPVCSMALLGHSTHRWLGPKMTGLKISNPTHQAIRRVVQGSQRRKHATWSVLSSTFLLTTQDGS